jgi:hypothetical protein
MLLRVRRRTLRSAIPILAMIAVAAGPVGGFAENTIEVTPDQSVTVLGVFPSLRSVIAEVCQRGHVELRAFEAPDREVTVAYKGVPLTTALEGLLREESYLVGVAAADRGKPPRVTWIRVVAGGDTAPRQPEPTGAAATPTPPVPTLGFEVPATFGDAEFSSEDPEQRARALHAIASRLIASKQLMSADPQALAATLQQYPHARELVTQLRNEQDDPDIRARLDQVLASLH